MHRIGSLNDCDAPLLYVEQVRVKNGEHKGDYGASSVAEEYKITLAILL